MSDVPLRNAGRPSAPRFTPPNGWMNDPNGLIHFEGEWHLFYQYLPEGGRGGKHWGHAVSRDLVHWEDLTIALFPDELGEIFSGSCVSDARDSSGFFEGGSGLVAIFTHHLDRDGTTMQSQSLAYSRDRGRTWTKHAGNPVLASERRDFRDPKVFWHEPSRTWVMILAAGDRLELYRSRDLKEWSFSSAFGEMPEGWCWECPDLFALRDEGGREIWVVTVSTLDHANFRNAFGRCDTYYFSGAFDGHAFTPAGGMQRLSFGPDDYAAVTFANAPRDRRILIGWQNHWGYPWHSGQMTLPRELRWDGASGSLVQLLPEEVDGADAWPRLIPDSQNVLRTDAMEWEVTIPPDLAEWRLVVRRADQIVFTLERDTGRREWILQRADGSFPAEWEGKKEKMRETFTAPRRAPFAAASGDHRVLVGSHSVEAFCDGGRVYFSAQLFPGEGSWEASLQTRLNSEA